MSTKTITIMEDAYEVLARNKRNNESFSDLIRRTFKKGSIMEFAGAWSDMGEKEAANLKSRLEKFRELSDKEFSAKLRKA